ncbi:MAG: ABC transporter transmembrane domain-containing protein, partial [Raineya sp.]
MIIPVLEILFQNKPEVISQYPTFNWSVEYFVSLFKYFQSKIYYEEGASALLLKVCLLVVASVFLTNVFRYLTIRVLEKLKARLVGRVRQEVFEKTLNLHLGYFTEQRKGNILSRMTSDVAEVEFIITTSFKALFREPILLILY